MTASGETPASLRRGKLRWLHNMLFFGLVVQSLISGFLSALMIPIGIGIVGLLAVAALIYAAVALSGRLEAPQMGALFVIPAGGFLLWAGLGVYSIASCGGIMNCGRNEHAFEVLVPVIAFAAIDLAAAIVLLIAPPRPTPPRP